MRDLHALAAFLTRHLPHDVRIEGIEKVRRVPGVSTITAKPIAEASKGHALSIAPPGAPPFHFDRRRGVAFLSDLTRYAQHLVEHVLPPLLVSRGMPVISPGRTKALVPRGEARLLLQQDLIRLVRLLPFDFQVASAELASARETGNGLHLRRRESRTAELEVWVQDRHGHGKACFYVLPEDIADGYITVRVETYEFENGSYTITSTASGAVQGIGPDGTFTECAELVIEDTFDEEFDYGAPTGSSVDDTTVAWDSVRAAALGAIADAGAPELRWNPTFPEADWEAASAPRDQFITGTSSSDWGYIYGEGSLAGWNIYAPKMQLVNTGAAALEIEVTFTRRSDEHEEVGTVSLPRGATSDWLPWPTASTGEYWDAAITRVGIAGY